MYSYTFDEITGGILLNSSPTLFSKEPRPVYASEMDLLEFDKYWDYEKQNDIPYLWVESNVYYYKGKAIAKTTGGNLYTPPELTPHYDEFGNVVYGKEQFKLEPMDIVAMCEKNKDFLTILENTSVKLILKAYEKYRNKLDIFHVAFSGGKDSAVLLDLVKKALPKGSFVVIFGDTGMELSDTYAYVKSTKNSCEKEGIPFYIANSHLKPEDSWKQFGPPARVLRWCCSVHKSTPQTLKMREITGKNDYTGLDFVGVRAHESLARSKYEVENFGKKQKGQYSLYPILEWTSAEIWLYMFANNMEINNTYKKGNSRAGCLMCPMSNPQNDYVRYHFYKEEIDKFLYLITSASCSDSMNEREKQNYIVSGSWAGRRSGRNIANNKSKYSEVASNGQQIIVIQDPNNNWMEWFKTINLDNVKYETEETENGIKFAFEEKLFKSHPSIGKYIRQSLRKAAYCVGCKVCETNCKLGKLHFDSRGNVNINNCIQCHECHDIPTGCYVYNSLKLPQGERKMKKINCFDGHAPKRDWMVSFFELQNDFFAEHTLGPNMFSSFKRFLRDGHLIDGNHCTEFSKLLVDIGWETDIAMGLLLINLAYENSQFEWYIKNFDIGIYNDISEVRQNLIAMDLPKQTPNFLISAYKRICETPIGTVLNFGEATNDDLVRLKCNISDNRVVLYALYKFVEICNMEKEFHISVLYDEEVERDGVSPVRIFGLYNEEELQSILLGLTARYPEYINATFTNDLKTITLYDKTAEDVLTLFKEEN